MRCEVAREALSARLDGERENVPAARVDEHLSGCADCTAYAQALGALDLIGGRGPRAGGSAAPDLADSILAAARRDAAPERPRRARWSRSRILWNAAAVGAAATGGLVIALALHPDGWVIPVLLATVFVVTCILTTLAGRDPRRGARTGEPGANTAKSPGGQPISPGERQDAVILSMLSRIDQSKEVVPMSTITVPVEGLHCNGCVETITKDVSALPGVESVNIDLDTQGVSQVTISSTEPIDDATLDAAISAHGNFTVAR